jgi:hypothetical protein
MINYKIYCKLQLNLLFTGKKQLKLKSPVNLFKAGLRMLSVLCDYVNVNTHNYGLLTHLGDKPHSH